MPERHSSESYFVLGEGLLTESDGGGSQRRPSPSGRGRSGRGRSGAGSGRGRGGGVDDDRCRRDTTFRFTRIGPKGKQLDDATRKKLAIAMTSSDSGRSTLPAGFTYLGQFVDHDLTFDKTKRHARRAASRPPQLLQARSPSLDLDSLYGAGPTIRLGEVLRGRRHRT